MTKVFGKTTKFENNILNPGMIYNRYLHLSVKHIKDTRPFKHSLVELNVSSKQEILFQLCIYNVLYYNIR